MTKIPNAIKKRNLLLEVFDLVTANRFCPTVECEDCIFFVEGEKCTINKIQTLAKEGITELIAFIEENDKCSDNPGGSGGGSS